MDGKFSVPQTKRTIQTFISDRGKRKCLSWYGGAAVQMAWVTGICAKVPLTWRHILGLYKDIYCHQDDVFQGKSMLLDQDNARSHSACAKTAWFRSQSECARLASRSVSYWKCMAHHEKENQTTTITDCWASEVLHQARLDNNFACRTFNMLYSQFLNN